QQTEQEDDVRPLVVVQRAEVEAWQAQGRREHEQKPGSQALGRAGSGRTAVRPFTVHRGARAHTSSTEYTAVPALAKTGRASLPKSSTAAPSRCLSSPPAIN